MLRRRAIRQRLRGLTCHVNAAHACGATERADRLTAARDALLRFYIDADARTNP